MGIFSIQVTQNYVRLTQFVPNYRHKGGIWIRSLIATQVNFSGRSTSYWKHHAFFFFFKQTSKKLFTISEVINTICSARLYTLQYARVNTSSSPTFPTDSWAAFFSSLLLFPPYPCLQLLQCCSSASTALSSDTVNNMQFASFSVCNQNFHGPHTESHAPGPQVSKYPISPTNRPDQPVTSPKHRKSPLLFSQFN